MLPCAPPKGAKVRSLSPHPSFPCLILLVIFSLFSSNAGATPSENLGIDILPAPGPVVVDGKFNDWDLSGSIFASANVETQRDDYAVWLAGMYDAKYLYVLARYKDKTPLNNPGLTFGSYGWNGDCLQFRIITHPATSDQLTSNFTAWKGSDGADVVDIDYAGGPAHINNAKQNGAEQAFQVDADKGGYVQEIAIPWSLITKDGKPLNPGDQFRLTFEPNFTVGTNGRWSVKDVFQPNMSLDRVFTFMNSPEWGTATLTRKGHLPQRPVRIAGGRTFPVKMEDGVPVVDWTGLIQQKKSAGFKTITFNAPSDGYVSLNVFNSTGHPVCQLINGSFFTKGAHAVLWDGLATANFDHPGTPVPSGQYTYRAIFNKGLALKLRGWADNSGKAPWDNGPTTNWGGDHGVPSDCTNDDSRMYLGWSEAESGKAVVATDFSGNVLWRNPSGPLVEADLLAAAANALYVSNAGPVLYRLDPKTGAFTSWSSNSSATINPLTVWDGAKPAHVDGLAAADGKVYFSFRKENVIVEADGASGGYINHYAVPSPGMIKTGPDNSLYIVSGGDLVVKLNPADGSVKTIASGLTNATGVALDAAGNIYVGVRDPDNQVKVFDKTGSPLKTIGIAGGRPIGAPWNPNGLRYAAGMTVDPSGNLWVAESNDLPKRISVWNTETAKFVQEFFGATHYGAIGGSIDPRDPDIMVGSGCEWRIDPKTGHAAVDYVFPQKTDEKYSDNGIGESEFAIGSNGRLYVAISPAWAYEHKSAIYIYERLGDANYKLRATISDDGDAKTTTVWSDENGDGAEQPSEVTTVNEAIRFTGWYMGMSESLGFYGNGVFAKPTGFTSCGAPKYDLANAERLNGVNPDRRGMPSSDNKQVLVEDGDDGDTYSTFDCYDLATKEKLWSYPDNFVNVHGSHNAPPSEAGKIFGSYGSVGSALLPAPIGNVWVIPTNVGEWHILTQDGFYLARLFQPDPLQVTWPDPAVPGADLTNSPPGGGGEDFGGGITLGSDGKFYVEAGHTAYWNLELTGLNDVRELTSGKISMSSSDVRQAASFHDDETQIAQGQRTLAITPGTPQLSGNFDGDFQGHAAVSYEKGDDTLTRSAASYDDQNLYLAWNVRDNTPWINGAGDPASMYIGGDTVDFQIGTNASADPNRTDAAAGDLRLSIGSIGGKNIAELYRKVSTMKQPAVFHSGVIPNYTMDYVATLSDARIVVSKGSDGYTVEAAVPLTDLGLHPADGLKLRGDFGVTFGDPSGQRTRLRSYWSNQHAGIVDDAVFELMMQPQYWGELTFRAN